jgi:hypothetical protein
MTSLRNAKYLFAIILCALLIIISSVLPSNFAYVSGALVGVGATLLGSFVVIWYETSKEDRESVEKRKRALAVVLTNATQALGKLETAPKHGTLMVEPFSSAGWDILTISGSYRLDQGLDRKIADMYERLSSLNYMVNWSLSTHFSPNQTLSKLTQTAQNMDVLIHEQVKILIPRLKLIKNEIEKELGLQIAKE